MSGARIAATVAILLTFAGSGGRVFGETPATRPSRTLGVTVVDVGTGRDAAKQLAAAGGNLVVDEVSVGSRAERMGFQAGDVIKRINGKPVTTLRDVVAAVHGAERLKVEILRDHRQVTLSE